MKKAVLIRVKQSSEQTLGYLSVFEGEKKVFECRTLELPHRNNERNISSIPEGEYLAKKVNSPTYGNVFEVLNVPNRSHILIHAGNFYTDTKGCIIVGNAFRDINADGVKDVLASKSTLAVLNGIADEVKLRIIDES